MITIIYDTETTGLIKPSASNLDEQPYITEIFCLKILQAGNGTMTVIDEFESLVKPPIPISAEITRMTGIDDNMVKDAPAFFEIAKPLGEFFTGASRLVAHNLAFDRSMLANELLRCGKVLNFPWPVEHMCTVEKTLHIEQRRLNLTKLHEFLFNEGFPNAHRAKNDVMPLFRCYEELTKRGML
jgi:DNA polymerase-3 subunit epsilon